MSEPLSWGHTTLDTACPLDCPDACSLAVTVERGRVVRIDGSHRQATTNGFICAKVRRFDERMYGEARIRHPAVRQGPKGGGRFRRVSWDEALERIASRLGEVRDTWGGEAILPFSYGGSNGLLTQDTTDADLFHQLGASRLARTVCAAPTGAANQALYGRMPGVTYGDYRHARLIVLWGANPSTSGIHLVPFIRDAQREGAQLVVVDPRRTPLAKQADLHLQLRPGTDLPLALALHRHLFTSGAADLAFLDAHARGAERLKQQAAPWTFVRAAAEAGIETADLERFAHLYAGASPAVIRCGWGLERNRNGGNAALAVLALPAVAGKFGVRGGGYSMSNSAAWRLPRRSRVPEPATRLVNMNHLGRWLVDSNDPPIKLLFVYNCNPVATMPHQGLVVRGLEREDLFTVVFDQVRTDTASYADVLLPATTFLEHYDLVRAYGPISLQLARPIVEAVGESRPNVEVFSELGARLGLDGFARTESEGEVLMRVAAGMPGAIAGPLLEEGSAPPPDGEAPVQFVDVFPRTPDGRIDLAPAALEESAPLGLYAYQPDPASEQYPLALISPAGERTISSTLGELRDRPARLALHPQDAGRRGIAEGDAVRLFNEQAEVQCVASLDEGVRPGTAVLPKGLWRRHTLNGATANALAPDTLTDLGGGACFNDARVEIARLPHAPSLPPRGAIPVAADPRAR